MRSNDTSGMETPVSMFLLLTASLLIASIGSSLLDHDGGRDDLFDLRSSQVRQMGEIMASWQPMNGADTLLDMLKSENGTRTFHKGDPNMTLEGHPLEECVRAFFECSPDGLDPFILVFWDEDPFTVNGEHAEWRSPGEISVRLVLPIQRGTVEVLV